MWKSPADTPSSVPLFSPPAKTATFGHGGNKSFGVSIGSAFWPSHADSAAESFASAFNNESTEKKQTNGNVCRLFGFELVENVNVDECFSAASVSGAVAADQPVPSNEFDSGQQSEPLNINQSDIPSGSGDPEKSSLRSPQESQSRQIRSCTKVIISLLDHSLYQNIYIFFWVTTPKLSRVIRILTVTASCFGLKECFWQFDLGAHARQCSRESC